MKRLFLFSLLSFFFFVTAAYAGERSCSVKIKLSFNDKTVIVAMYDNDAARQVIERLPVSLEFTDFAGEEKITNFSPPFSLDNAPRGMAARAGKMFIYAPWGNMGFFYKDHGYVTDNNLIPLGEIETGLEYLATQKGGFTAKLEILN